MFVLTIHPDNPVKLSNIGPPGSCGFRILWLYIGEYGWSQQEMNVLVQTERRDVVDVGLVELRRL
jgi:hypothetical protein